MKLLFSIVLFALVVGGCDEIYTIVDGGIVYGEDGQDGQDGEDGNSGVGTRTVYTGLFGVSSEATIHLDIDPSNMPSIQAWGYCSQPSVMMFGVGWYPAVMSVADDGALRIFVSGAAGNEYRVVVVE